MPNEISIARKASVDLDVSSPGILPLGCSRRWSRGFCNARTSGGHAARNPSCHSVDGLIIIHHRRADQRGNALFSASGRLLWTS